MRVKARAAASLSEATFMLSYWRAGHGAKSA
jgi:hypothetical protein